MGWGSSYMMQAVNDMYRATGDLVYLEQNLALTRATVDATDSALGKQTWNGVTSDAWGSFRYRNPTEQDEYAVHIVHTGMIAWGALEFLHLAQPHMAELGLTETERDDMIDALVAALDFHDQAWFDTTDDSGGSWIFKDEFPDSRDGSVVPFNMMSAPATAYYWAWRNTGNQDHYDRVVDVATYIKARLYIYDCDSTDVQAYFYSYYLPTNPVTTNPRDWANLGSLNGDDFSHGALSASFPVLMAQEEIVFDSSDLDLFANTILHGFARNEEGVLAANVTGRYTSNSPNYVVNSGYWLRMADTHPEILDRLLPFYFNYQATPRLLDIAKLLVHAGEDPGDPLTLLVPSQYPTINQAINNAIAGDTILIEDSATYNERLVIDSAFTIMAAPGQTPVIKPPDSNVTYVILFDEGSGGAQFGSNDGGTIFLDATVGANTPYTGSSYRYVYHNYSQGETVMENVEFGNVQPGVDLGMLYIYPGPNLTQNSTVTLRNVTMDATHLRRPIRLTFMAGATINLENVVVDSAPDSPASQTTILFNQAGASVAHGTFNITDSVLRGAESVLWAIQTGGDEDNETVFNITNSYLGTIAGASTPSDSFVKEVLDVSSLNTTVNITGSVIEQTWPLGTAITMAHSAGQRVNITYSDILTRDIGIASVNVGTPSNRSLFVRNSNLLRGNVAGGNTNPVIDLTLLSGDTVDLDYNNYIGAIEPGSVQAGANSIIPGVVPSFFSPGAPDYEYGYDESVLLDGGSEGLPIGSFLNSEKPVPSNVNHWMNYN